MTRPVRRNHNFRFEETWNSQEGPGRRRLCIRCSGIGVSPVICIRFVICIRSVICIRPGIWSVNRICPGRSA